MNNKITFHYIYRNYGYSIRSAYIKELSYYNLTSSHGGTSNNIKQEPVFNSPQSGVNKQDLPKFVIILTFFMVDQYNLPQ